MTTTDKHLREQLRKAIKDYQAAAEGSEARANAQQRIVLYRKWRAQRKTHARRRKLVAQTRTQVAQARLAAAPQHERPALAVRMIEERHAAADAAGQQARREAVARAAGFSDPQQFQPTHLSFVAGAQPTASADGGGAPPTQKKGPFHRLFGFSSRRFLGRKSRRRQDGKGRRRRRTRRRRHPKRKKRRRRRTRRSRRRKRGRQTRKRH